MKKKTNIRRDRQRGAAVIEFALVVPLLLLFLFGIIEFSVILYDNAVVTNASREAAREWIEWVSDADKSTKKTSAILDGIVQDYTQDRLISLGSSGSSPTTTFEVAGTPTTNTQNYSSAEMLTVIVDYQYDFLFLPGFIEGFMPDLNLTAETTMMAE